MLNPCKPCCCPGAPCEQCMFGYNSAETNHRIMKSLLNDYINGDKPNGWANAKYYMELHKNWKEEMESEPPKADKPHNATTPTKGKSTMTDKQKLYLIDSILAHFRKMNNDERVARGADAILVAISAVLAYPQED